MFVVYLVDLLFGVREKSLEVFEGARVEHHLCLFVGSSHDVADSSQRCSLKHIHTSRSLISVGKVNADECKKCACARAKVHLHFDFLVTEQWYKEGDDTRVDDHLNLVVSAVRQVRQRPHGVYQDLDNNNSKVAYSMLRRHDCQWGCSGLTLVSV